MKGTNEKKGRGQQPGGVDICLFFGGHQKSWKKTIQKKKKASEWAGGNPQPENQLSSNKKESVPSKKSTIWRERWGGKRKNTWFRSFEWRGFKRQLWYWVKRNADYHRHCEKEPVFLGDSSETRLGVLKEEINREGKWGGHCKTKKSQKICCQGGERIGLSWTQREIEKKVQGQHVYFWSMEGHTSQKKKKIS